MLAAHQLTLRITNCLMEVPKENRFLKLQVSKNQQVILQYL